MHCLWVALLFSPWTLFNVDGAAVTNFYNSFTNKKFGGESSCVTETDVSASFGVEGENVRQKKTFFRCFHRLPQPVQRWQWLWGVLAGELLPQPRLHLQDCQENLRLERRQLGHGIPGHNFPSEGLIAQQFRSTAVTLFKDRCIVYFSMDLINTNVK